jgi:beta-alanine degradation protein BauB
MADVATHKLFENDRMVVWELLLEPGESSGIHTHHRSFFFHVLEGSEVEVSDARGQVLVSRPTPAGFTLSFELQGEELVSDLARIPVTHAAKNVGESLYREILIEVK